MRRGFTLIELIVVVAIVLILAAILIPVFDRTKRNSPRSSCQSNLKQIGLGFKQYLQDYDEKMPLISAGDQGWAETLQPYIKSRQIFHCPSGDKSYDAAALPSTDYFLNARVAGLHEDKIPAFGFTLLLGEGPENGGTNSHFSELPLDWRTAEKSPAKRHLDGANYGWVDGHVEWLRPEKVSTLSPLGKNAATATFAVR